MSDVNQKNNLGSATFSLSNKLSRVLWGAVYVLFFRFSPKPLFKYRTFILRLFGATIGNGVSVYPSATIWLPSNLCLGDKVAVGPNVNVYNQGQITIGTNSIISQGTHLCASTHDYNDPLHPLLLAPITIEPNVWVCADSFVGPYVTIKEGAVVGARSVVVKNVEQWSVYSGNPARKIKERARF
tara:strand:- start:19921 stop:20472 length:552 start_codon:yes stop_codon:yes gene_type:complete